MESALILNTQKLSGDQVVTFQGNMYKFTDNKVIL